MQNLIPSAADRIKRIIERLKRETDESVPSMVIPSLPGGVDDGDYGDPMQDRRPEFLKRSYDDMPGMTVIGREGDFDGRSR